MGDNKTITIFNQRLAGYLMQRGFILIGLGENHRCTGKNVFFFKDTEELQKAIEEHKKKAVCL